MKLYFLRHAEAEDGPIDDTRELTAKGRRDARRVGRFLKKIGVQLDLAFTSPLVRAGSTAEVVLEECPVPKKARLATVDQLLNGTTAAAFVGWLRTLPKVEAVLLVGHEPSLSGHVRRMAGVTEEAALPLSKGALARVDTDDRQRGALKLLISPRQIP